MTISAEEKKALKGRGIIADRSGETFVARVVTVNGVLTEEQLQILAEAASRFGNGTAALTIRMSVELQGIPYEKVEDLCKFLEAHGMYTGGTGPKVRPVVACKGTVCPHGLIDTQNLAAELHALFYVGRHDTVLPHKFKIGIGGCPNNCIKPQLNDFGVMGWKAPADAGHFPEGKGYKIMLGGIWGKKQRVADKVPGVFNREEVKQVLAAVLDIWKEEGKTGERFGHYLDRIGLSAFMEKLDEALPELKLKES